jgi:hypothetical protein
MTTAETKKVTYWIPQHNLAPLTEKLEKINRKAAKLGAFAIQWKQTGNTKVEEVVVGYEITLESAPNQVAIKRKIVMNEVEVVGIAPQLNGWTFIATLEHANELGNVLRVVPGYEKDLPQKFRDASAENCDHCHTRRQRNDTYVLSHENGRWAQVGSTCLKDFLGYNDPHGAARFCEMLFQVGAACESATDCGGGHGSGEYVDDLREFLAFCIAQVRHDGFISRKKAREEEERGNYLRSTATAALNALHPTYHNGKPQRQPWEVPVEDDYQVAEKVANWCVALKDRDPASLNDFMHNLKVATATGYVGGRKAGIAAAAVPAYRRETEPKDDFSKSRHVGQKGERVEGNAKLVKIFTFNGQFGETYLHKFLTEGGNLVVWFASKPSGMLEGNSYQIRGTVKKHDVRDGIQQTVLSRVVVGLKKAKKAAKTGAA